MRMLVSGSHPGLPITTANVFTVRFVIKPLMTYFTGERKYGLQNAKKNCILQKTTDRLTGSIEKLEPDTPY